VAVACLSNQDVAQPAVATLNNAAARRIGVAIPGATGNRSAGSSSPCWSMLASFRSVVRPFLQAQPIATVRVGMPGSTPSPARMVLACTWTTNQPLRTGNVQIQRESVTRTASCSSASPAIKPRRRRSSTMSDPFPWCDCGACQLRRALNEVERLKQLASNGSS